MLRRTFFRRLALSTLAGVPFALVTRARAAAPSAPILPQLAAMKPNEKPPAHAPERVREVVAVAHRDLEAVQQLVTANPTLVNACWDWGGGDFETPLGAAGHTGGEAIARWLLSRGARPEVYAAAMLGHLETVQAMVTAFPTLPWTPGPHGFSLYHHAKVGGDSARPVLEWLGSIGVPSATKV